MKRDPTCLPPPSPRRTWLRWSAALGLGWAGQVPGGLAKPAQPHRAGAAAGPSQPAMPLALWGYHPWWMREDWRRRDLTLFDRVSLFEIEIGEEGQLVDLQGWPGRWAALLAAMRGRGAALDVVVFLSSAARFERVFGDAGRRERLLGELRALGEAADGVQLDVEVYDPLSRAAQRGYRELCARLHAALHALPGGRLLSAFGPVGAATDLYDRGLLASIDRLVVQGYDAHHAGSRHAGPVAPLRGPHPFNWGTALRHYLGLGWPRQRLLMSLPGFGYEWPTASPAPGARVTGPALQTSYARVDAELLPRIRVSAREEAARHGLRRDPVSGSPYYVFRDADGGWHQGWFEDELSLAAKLAFVQEERLAGAALFPLGYDGGAFDALLRRARHGR
jgi:hypothetical protein